MKRNKTRWHSFEGLTEKQRREKAKRGVIIAVFLFGDREVGKQIVE